MKKVAYETNQQETCCTSDSLIHRDAFFTHIVIQKECIMHHTLLSQSCETIRGVNSALFQKLNKCGIYSIADLLWHFPFRYQDKTRITPIHDLKVNDFAVIFARIQKVDIVQGRRPVLCCYVDDNSGILCLRFFHFNKAQVAAFKQNTLLRAFGEVKEFAHQRQMIHPEYRFFNQATDCAFEENLTGIYPSTEGLTQSRLHRLIQQSLQAHTQLLQELEWMDTKTRDDLQVPDLVQALHHIHMPPRDTSLALLESKEHPAFKRLIIEELVAQRLSMQCARAKRAQLSAPIFSPPAELIEQFTKSLPFSLTKAQAIAAEEIAADLSKAKPMLRLVQGDVGSGKTTVAALAALHAIANGYQVAMMAPTDLLSEQHFHTLEPYFSHLKIKSCRLTGKLKAKERKENLEKTKNHDCHFLIGTHALFQDQVEFAQLGLIIIDEQHRFGVAQRLLLQQKNRNDALIPHQLLMTATPIPRTLAMTKFAHLDISIMNELPPNRIPVNTVVLHEDMRGQVVERLYHNLAQGHQAYWVCTLIDESEKIQCMAATETAAELQAQLPNVRVGLVHGRMKALEKEAAMAAFKAGSIDLLVATTVIEVGVDVPNASLMIIENAERLGLSQLHQLRGRVGRGNQQAHCLLLYQKPLSKMAAERLKVMKSTTDGFVIAEKDLSLRGAGEILGARQTGYKQFKIAQPERDKHFFPLISKLTENLMAHSPKEAERIVQCWLGQVEEFLHA